MWLWLGVFVFGLAAGGEVDIFELADGEPEFCRTSIPGKCGEQIAEGCRTKDVWFKLMLDASAKQPSGIFYGNTINLGYFDECLEIDVPEKDILGKYCLGTADVSIPKNNTYINKLFQKIIEHQIILNKPLKLQLAQCVPDSCSAEDIAKYIFPGDGVFTEDTCQTKETQAKWTTGDSLASAFFAIMIVIITASTSYDFFLLKNNAEAKYPILLAFSFITNGTKLFRITKSSNDIRCIHGLRAISIMWIVILHIFSLVKASAPYNGLDIDDWYLSEKSMFVSGAGFAVDTFFFLSGIMVVYGYLRSHPNGGFFNIPKYYLHRYLRLTPSIAALLLIHVTLVKHMGSGPLWPASKSFMYDYCVEYWWTVLLYVQNWINRYQMCVGVTWYLCVDMQLFILSPLILIPLKKYTKTTVTIVGIFALASIASAFHASWIYNLNGFINSGEVFSTMYYTATYTRASPWLIGIIAGYFIYEIKFSALKFKPHKALSWALWISALVIMSACVFCGNNLTNVDMNNKALNSSYLSFVRPAWAICLTWVVISCMTGFGGPIDAFLSLKPFQIIAKVSYNIYILHYSVLQLFANSVRTSKEFSPLWEIYHFWGHFTVVFGLAVIWSLSFESPVLVLEKYIFGTHNKKEKSKKEEAVSGNISTITVLNGNV